MNKKGVGVGIFLLGLGVVWLLMNLNIINFNVFKAIFTLWPLIFVVIGVNIIFKHNNVVKALTWLGFLAIIIIYGSFNNNNNNTNFNLHFGNNTKATSNHIEEEMRPGIKNGKLKINVGAVQLNLGDESDKLLKADSSNDNCKYNIDYSGSNVDVDIDNEKTKVFGANNNKLDVNINKDIEWDIKMDTGASSGEADFSNLKVKKVDIDAGAVNYKIKMGANIPVSDIKLDSGASNFEFDLPKDAGIRVSIDGALNNTNLSELGWTKNGSNYESPNYNGAQCKINLDADIGVAKLRVNLY